MKTNDQFVADALQALLPEAKCALDFSSPFQCLVAVMLSAQTTDVAVNRVTPSLFLSFPNAFEMAKASSEDVKNIIRSIGLYDNKARNIIAASKVLVERYNGDVPSTREELTSLPGVGIKTANVVLAECYGVPAIAVDTHVSRVAFRLGYCKKGEDPVRIEKILERRFPKDLWIRLHHQIIWFGRLVCHAKKPECDRCPLQSACVYFKKTSSMTGR